MLRSILILLLGLGVTIGVLWTAVHTLKKVLHIKDSGIDPAAAPPEAGSPYHAAEARRARGVLAAIAAAVVAILALLAVP